MLEFDAKGYLRKGLDEDEFDFVKRLAAELNKLLPAGFKIILHPPDFKPTDVGGVNLDYGNLDFKVDGEKNVSVEANNYSPVNIIGLKPGTIELVPISSLEAFFLPAAK